MQVLTSTKAREIIEVVLQSDKSNFEAYETFCLNLFTFDCSYLEKVARNLINLIVKTASSKAAVMLKVQIGSWQFSSVEEVSLKAKEILMRELNLNPASSSERPRITITNE